MRKIMHADIAAKRTPTTTYFLNGSTGVKRFVRVIEIVSVKCRVADVMRDGSWVYELSYSDASQS